MLSYTQSLVNELKQKTEGTKFSIRVLCSEAGLGKYTAVAEFIRQCNYRLIEIDSYAKFSPLEAIINILQTDAIDVKDLHAGMLKWLQNNEKAAILFNKNTEYSGDLLNFIDKLIVNVLNHSLAINSLIVLFIIDEKAGNMPEALLPILIKYSGYVDYLNGIRPWTASELKELFTEIYPTVCCDEKNLNKIISASFGNPYILKQTLEFLKRKSIFYYQDNTWHLKDIDDYLLNRSISDIVQHRYQALDETLKETIQKASIIGCEFDVETLKNPLKVYDACNLLQKIEEVSRLIHKKLPDNYLYCFENVHSQISINNLIDFSQRKAWNLAIANYFARKIEYQSSTYPVRKICEMLYKAAFYYQEAEDFEMAISFYFKLISQYMALGYYRSAIEMAENIRRLDIFPPDNELHKILLIYEMESLEAITDMPRAYSKFEEYEKLNISNKDTYLWREFKKAYYLYGIGQTNESYRIISQFEQKRIALQGDSSKLAVLIFNLLSAIKETCKLDYVDDYNYAIALAKNQNLEEEYYYLLRKANFAHSDQIAIRLMETAYRYFEDKNNFIQQAYTAHNIGTEYFYMLNPGEALKYIQKAEHILREKGSESLIYTQNSVAIYKIIFEHHYEEAMEYLEQLDFSYYEPFTKLGILNNKATCLRKLGLYEKTAQLLGQIESINQESDHYVWFQGCLLLQKGYLAKARKDHLNAYRYFYQYLLKEYSMEKANKVIAIRNIEELSSLLGIPFPQEYNAYRNMTDKCGNYLYEHSLMFCDFFFWE